MARYIIFVLLFIGLQNSVKSQSCDCSENFRFVVNRIQKNYVGYLDKVTPKNSKQFAKFTDSLQNIANKSNPYRCLSLCREWLDFFKDNHITFGMDFDLLPPDSVKRFFSKEETTKWNENQFKIYLSQNNKKLDPIEGVWSYGVYEVGIVKDLAKHGTEFIGFIIKADGFRWVASQVKFKLKKIAGKYKTIVFRGGDHSVNLPEVSKLKDTLDFGIFGKWYKGPNLNTQKVLKEPIDLTPKFKVIDSVTSLFELPSFESMAYIKVVDSLVKVNESKLKNSKHLIIDLRDNPGGSVYVFKSLLPYIYTNPILTVGGMVLATEDNIKDGYSIEYPEASDSIQNVLKQDLSKLKAHVGELYNIYPVDTIKFHTVLKNPQRVDFLVNEHTASAAELFLLQAKQSTKVKIFGTNTSGSVDYGEVVNAKVPCKFFNLFYPAGRSSYSIDHPLDNIGIEPDVRIPSDTKDWIDFVKRY